MIHLLAHATMTAMIAMQTKLSQRPQRNIVDCGTAPVANTIAFGGVATGNMNAQEDAIATAADAVIGGKPNAAATGKKSAAEGLCSPCY